MLERILKSEKVRLSEEYDKLHLEVSDYMLRKHKLLEYMVGLVEDNYDHFVESLGLSGEEASPEVVYERVSSALTLLDGDAIFEKKDIYTIEVREEADDSTSLGWARLIFKTPLRPMGSKTQHLLTDKGKEIIEKYRLIQGTVLKIPLDSVEYT